MTSIFLFISETKQDRAISTKFFTRRVFGNSTVTFPKYRFPTTFGNHLEFLRKTKKQLSRISEQDTMISPKFLTRRLSAESTGNFLQNNILPPLLVAILNFCVKCKNVFISETERDRAISTKFLTSRLFGHSTDDFPPKSFSRHFWWPS